MSDTLFNKVTGTFPSSSNFKGESWDGSALSSTNEWRKISVLSGGTTTTWCKNTEPFWIMFPQGGTFTLTAVGDITPCTLKVYTKNSNGNFVFYSSITATSSGIVLTGLNANTKYYLIKSGSTSWATSITAYHHIMTEASATIGGDIRSVVLNSTTLTNNVTITDIVTSTNYYNSTINFYAPFMFTGAIGITDATRLEFPENTYYADNACYRMFDACSGLVLPPIELPATTATNNMYYMMFYNCRELTKTPIIYLTNPTNGCLTNMFSKCLKLSRVYIKSMSWQTAASSYWLNGAGISATNSKHFYITDSVTWTSTERNESTCPTDFTLHNSTNDNINTLFPY